MLVSKDFTLEAAHVLPRHPGKCSRMHGHSWTIRVALEGGIHPATQFVIDYHDLSAIVDPIIELWDHRVLNSFIRYPSAENIAANLADQVRAKLDVALINRLVVSVAETRKTWAEWDSDRREDLAMLDKAGLDAEWKSPMPNVPIPTVCDFDKFIKEEAEKVRKHQLALLHHLMLHDQYQLYKDLLITDPALPAKVGKEDVQ